MYNIFFVIIKIKIVKHEIRVFFGNQFLFYFETENISYI